MTEAGNYYCGQVNKCYWDHQLFTYIILLEIWSPMSSRLCISTTICGESSWFGNLWILNIEIYLEIYFIKHFSSISFLCLYLWKTDAIPKINGVTSTTISTEYICVCKFWTTEKWWYWSTDILSWISPNTWH